MADVVGVIDGLKKLEDYYQKLYSKESDRELYCKYRDIIDILDDAVELLQGLIKVKVVFAADDHGNFETDCGNCGCYLDKAYSQCPQCGKELDWDIYE